MESGLYQEIWEQTQSVRFAQADLFMMCCSLFIQLFALYLFGYQVWMVYHPGLSTQVWTNLVVTNE